MRRNWIGALLVSSLLVVLAGCGSSEAEPASKVVQPGDPGYLKGDAGASAGPAKGSTESTSE
jgi:hypothetical protein